jgi:hypothetical protein
MLGCALAKMKETRNIYTISVGKPVAKYPLERSWDDNIKMDLTDISCEDRSWKRLGQDHVRWQ